MPNPSFENYANCPTFASQLNLAEPWFNPNTGSPEYFNTCATWGSYMSLPAGTTGHYQYPKTGNGFAGIWTFRTDVNNMREYIEVELISELEAGKCYYLEFYVNAANDFPYASDGVGAHVSVGEITAGNANPLLVSPQVENPAGSIISDTLAWTKVSGYFTASGGEDHLTIGNFKSDALTNWIEFNPDVWYQQSSYLYIDDVLLELRELDVELGSDTSLCEGEMIALDATTDDAEYNWENGTTLPTRQVSVDGEYWVDVTVGGCSISDTIMVDIEPVPSVILGSDITLCEQENLVISAITNVSNITWQDGSMGTDFHISEPGIYWAEVSNDCGVATDTLKIELKECNCSVYIPNAFTPNNDGINDKFSIKYDCNFSKFDFRIFDRWGKMLFQSANPNFEWDGEEIPIGTYTYQLDYSSNEVSVGKGLELGVISLIR